MLDTGGWRLLLAQVRGQREEQLFQCGVWPSPAVSACSALCAVMDVSGGDSAWVLADLNRPDWKELFDLSRQGKGVQSNQATGVKPAVKAL